MQTYPHNSTEKIFPIIDLGDIVLREKNLEDVENFFHYYSDPQVNKFIMSEIPHTLQEARQELLYWRGIFYRNDGIYFAIADKKTNKMIGSIGLTSLNAYNNRIELSYDLAKEYWRQGISFTAANAVIEYAFEVMKVNRIEASIAVGNEASRELLLKCRFKLEGVLRQHRYHRGEYVDVYFMSLLKKDYLSQELTL